MFPEALGLSAEVREQRKYEPIIQNRIMLLENADSS